MGTNLLRDGHCNVHLPNYNKKLLVYVFSTRTSVVTNMNYKCLHLFAKLFLSFMLFSQLVDIGCFEQIFNLTQSYEL